MEHPQSGDLWRQKPSSVTSGNSVKSLAGFTAQLTLPINSTKMSARVLSYSSVKMHGMSSKIQYINSLGNRNVQSFKMRVVLHVGKCRNIQLKHSRCMMSSMFVLFHGNYGGLTEARISLVFVEWDSERVHNC